MCLTTGRIKLLHKRHPNKNALGDLHTGYYGDRAMLMSHTDVVTEMKRGVLEFSGASLGA